MDTKRTIRDAIFIGMVLLTIATASLLTERTKEYNDLVEEYNNYSCSEAEERCNMRFNRTTGDTVNGLYQPGKYFCVWTEGVEENQIAETTFHELAHHYNYEEHDHFKGDFK